MDQATIEEGGVRLSGGRLLTPQDVEALDRQVSAVRSVLDAAKAEKANDPPEAVRLLTAGLAGLRTLETEVTNSREGEESPVQTLARLRRQADDGRSYREDLIEQALTEGVRAYGNDFAREAEKADLAGASLETIKRRRDQWKRTGDQVLPGGRKTTEGDDPPNRREGKAFPAAAYR